jgi:hypothetical protein
MWGRTSSVAGSERFAARRRSRRRRIFIAFLILLALVVAGVLYELSQPALRISHVQIYGGDQSLADFATSTMQGKYLGLVPRDSTFFYPASAIRSAILATHPDIAAVSFFRRGLTGLSVRLTYRVAIGRWCGLSPTSFTVATSSGGAHGSEEYCYVFDASGYIFAPYASTTQVINPFKLYVPLASASDDPLRATLSHTEKLPGAFDFARQIGTLGSLVSSIVIRSDEVDDLLVSGTRVTYLLGQEESSYTALVSAKGNLNLTDGSLIYVDLRFPGKVYLKKKE